MLDFEEARTRLATLQDRARSLSASLPVITDAPREAQDPTGAVSVSFGEGETPTIRITNGWIDKVEPDHLAEVVNATVVQARFANFSPGDGSTTPVTETPQQRAMEHLDPQSPRLNDVMRTLNDLADASRANVEKLSAKLDGDAMAQVEAAGVVGAIDSRQVTVVLSRGLFVRCTIDTNWARRQSGNAISMAIAEAQEDAARQEAEQRPDEGLAQGPRELSFDQLVTDPMSLVNYLVEEL